MNTAADEQQELVEKIVQLKNQNPDWGYRKIWRILHRENVSIGKNRVYRILKEKGCLVPRMSIPKNSMPKKAENLTWGWFTW